MSGNVEKVPSKRSLRQLIVFPLSLFRRMCAWIYVHILYKLVPKRRLSRAFGRLMNLHLPVFLRAPVYCLWTIFFDCHLEEMARPLRSYESLGEFFSRPLRDGVRSVSRIGIACPVDARVMVAGQVAGEGIGRVKGLTYSLARFLTGKAHGDQPVEEISQSILFSNVPTIAKRVLAKPLAASAAAAAATAAAAAEAADAEALLHHKDGSTGLFYCVLYLAPGDYHRIHHPVTWKVHERVHVPGSLYPVQPTFMRRMRGLLSVNERVVLTGEYEHGFFAAVAVGAQNVGSIYITHPADELKTNESTRKVAKEIRARSNSAADEAAAAATNAATADNNDDSSEDDVSFVDTLRARPMEPETRRFDPPVLCERGSELGGFSLGSTVVLIFEAPVDFTFTKEDEEKVHVGELLGSCTRDIVNELDTAIANSSFSDHDSA